MLALSGCGSSDAPAAAPTSVASATPGVAPSTAEPVTPSFDLLDEAGLEGALLTVQDMPDGFSQDPPSDQGPDKNFCDYKVPHDTLIRVRRDFTKGSGMSAEVASTGIRQYASDSDAKDSFDALVEAMNTCTGETYQGEKLTYSVTKAPDLGAGSIGIRIESEAATILQNFVLVGPTLVNTGIAGLTGTDFDTGINLLKAQVARYSREAAE